MKRKVKYKNIIIISILCLLIVILIFSILNIVDWMVDGKNIDKQVENAQNEAEIEEIVDNEKTEIIEQKNTVDQENPYWDYIKMNLIDVNFNNLKKTNNEIKGWIQVNGTNINYPFVQTNNNDYYLNHSFDKSYNEAGWVFLDYRNNISSFDKNTIIYAHGRYDNTMFGSLKNILSSNWYENRNNYVIKLSTAYENTLWQVFSVYRIPNTSDYIKTKFTGDDDYKDFLELITNRSQFNFYTATNTNDKVLTLSTCWNDYEKVVMHAKLIKREVK